MTPVSSIRRKFLSASAGEPLPTERMPAVPESSESPHHLAAQPGRIGSTSADVEAQRHLIQQVFRVPAEDGPRVVLFAAHERGNGSSTVCARAATALEQSTNGTVCVIDANLERPSLGGIFEIQQETGLLDWLLSDDSPLDYGRQLSGTNLFVIPAGSRNLAQARYGALKSFDDKLQELRTSFDYVLIDAPALDTSADAAYLGQSSDGVVLVLEANSTNKHAALRACQTLRDAGVPTLAAVLNKRTYPIPASIYRWL